MLNPTPTQNKHPYPWSPRHTFRPQKAAFFWNWSPKCRKNVTPHTTPTPHTHISNAALNPGIGGKSGRLELMGFLFVVESSSTWMCCLHTDSIFRQIIHHRRAKSSSTIPKRRKRTQKKKCVRVRRWGKNVGGPEEKRKGNGVIILRGLCFFPSSCHVLRYWVLVCCAGDCVLVCVCSHWLGCRSRLEKQLFSGDLASGES